jgi:hypothetical protein
LNAYELTCPGAQRVVEAVEARESKRLFHLRNKKTVADQIQKCAKGRRRRSHGHWFRDSSAIGAAQAACSFRQIDRNLCYVGQFAHGLFGLGLNVM